MTVREEIDSRVAWLERRLADQEERLERASDAGGELAASVARYLRFPESPDRLRLAYGTFMAAHAGNFSEPVLPAHRPVYIPDLEENG